MKASSKRGFTSTHSAPSAAPISFGSKRSLPFRMVRRRLWPWIVPSLTFIPDALPESARALDEVLARAKEIDDAVAAQRGTAYAGEPDPYKKPREVVDEDELDDPDEGEDLPAAEPDGNDRP